MINIDKALGFLKAACEGKALSREELFKNCESLKFFPEFASISDAEKNELVDTYEKLYGGRTFDPGITLLKEKEDTWLFKRKDNISHDFEDRYRKYLNIYKNFGEKSIDSIVTEAERILSLCADPESNVKKRGLVMGDVQSGKTSNYLALANMACDYGYKIILILAGMTESLRKQTQSRVDEGLIGADSDSIENNSKVIYQGVGKFEQNGYYAVPFTTIKRDFSSCSCSPNDLNKPQVLVIKKNKQVLKNAITWLKPGNNVSGQNILIIDDECDNASVNTKSEEDPSVINELIRKIYNNFPCATYVGYTATPFANIFINPYASDPNNEDLFPEDFIHRLKSSDGMYFGVEKVFSDDNLHIKIINEDEQNLLPAKHKKDTPFTILPESLKNAICVFLLCNCVRTLRNQENKHRTMMINISSYNDVQYEIKKQVEDYVNSLKYSIPGHDRFDIDRFIKDKELERIYKLYKNDSVFSLPSKEYDKIINEEFTFEEIKNVINSEIQKFVVAIVNNKVKKDQRFDYDKYPDGARVISIGGFVLSRGLTLEGLMTSYYNRNSANYDTLLQMCRWFGYRPRYEDLCSIYMTQINRDCFGAVVDAIEDLDQQLANMRARGGTPRDFGLMVRESPETLETNLLVTARNKMKNTESQTIYLNYYGVAVDTSKLSIDHVKNDSNFKAVKKLYEDFKSKGLNVEEVKNRIMYRNVDSQTIANFVSKLDIHYENKKFDKKSIAEFIRDNKEFKKWDIVFASGRSSEDNDSYFSLGSDFPSIPSVQRSFNYKNGEDFVRISKTNNRLIEPGIFNSGLTEAQIEQANEFASKRKTKETGKKNEPIAADYLSVDGRKPLLVILPVNLKQDNKTEANSDFTAEKQEIIDSFKDDFLMGFGIGFPGSNNTQKVKYVLNKIKIDELMKSQEDEDDIEEDEDD